MSGSNRSVTARDITGSSIVTGDHNTVSTTMKQVPLPPADQVDVKAELAALREALAGLQKVPDRGKLDRAVEDAADEAAKPEPTKRRSGVRSNAWPDTRKQLMILATTPKSWCRASRRSPSSLAPMGIVCSRCSASPHSVRSGPRVDAHGMPISRLGEMNSWFDQTNSRFLHFHLKQLIE
jgi:hypothetical protein